MLLTFQFDAFRYALANWLIMISLKKKKHNVYSRYVIPLIKTKLRSIYLIILSDNKNEKLILLENISFLHFPPNFIIEKLRKFGNISPFDRLRQNTWKIIRSEMSTNVIPRTDPSTRRERGTRFVVEKSCHIPETLLSKIQKSTEKELKSDDNKQIDPTMR